MATPPWRIFFFPFFDLVIVLILATSQALRAFYLSLLNSPKARDQIPPRSAFVHQPPTRLTMTHVSPRPHAGQKFRLVRLSIFHIFRFLSIPNPSGVYTPMTWYLSKKKKNQKNHMLSMIPMILICHSLHIVHCSLVLVHFIHGE